MPGSIGGQQRDDNNTPIDVVGLSLWTDITAYSQMFDYSTLVQCVWCSQSGCVVMHHLSGHFMDFPGDSLSGPELSLQAMSHFLAMSRLS